MNLTRLAQMGFDDHLLYPLFPGTAGVEWDIQHLELIHSAFVSQHDHRDRGGLGFIAKFFGDNGNDETVNLSLGNIIGFFMNRGAELNNRRYKFFFVHQPGASNRIWMPCTQVLLSIFEINPSFPYLVGMSHVSAFGSYVRNQTLDPLESEPVQTEDAVVAPVRQPKYHESWWSTSAPRAFRRGNPVIEELINQPGWAQLFDVKTLDRNGWVLLIWRLSVCIQYDLDGKKSTVVALDDGGAITGFTEGRFQLTMSNREQMFMKDDPFVIHVLFLAQPVRDWTFSMEIFQRELNGEQERAFRGNLERAEYEAISRSLHDLMAYQLKNQNHLAMMPVMIEAAQGEHQRLKTLLDIPNYAFDRVEALLRRLKIQAENSYEHFLRMEKQAKNIQEQLIDLTNLAIETRISQSSAATSENTRAISSNTETVDRLIRSLNERLTAGGESGGDAEQLMPGIIELVAHSQELSEASTSALKEIRRSNIMSMSMLQSIQGTNSSADKNLDDLNKLVQAARDQGDCLHGIASLTLWALPIQLFTGFVSMDILNWNWGKHSTNKDGPFVGGSLWAFIVFLILLVHFFIQIVQIARVAPIGNLLWPWARLWRRQAYEENGIEL